MIMSYICILLLQIGGGQRSFTNVFHISAVKLSIIGGVDPKGMMAGVTLYGQCSGCPVELAWERDSGQVGV